MSAARFTVYEDSEQWIASRWWYWKRADSPAARSHGPFPWRWLAVLAGWLGTR